MTGVRGPKGEHQTVEDLQIINDPNYNEFDKQQSGWFSFPF